MGKILCIPQRGIGDFVHALPLIHSLKKSFENYEIVIPVVDKRQEEDSRSLEKICKGIVCFSYKLINQEIENKRMSFYRNKSSPELYMSEINERMQFEKEMYEYYLKGEIYDLAIILRNFYINSISCPNQISLFDISKNNYEHIIDTNLRFAEVLGIPKILDFSLNITNDYPPKNNLGEILSLPTPYVVLVLGAGRKDKKWGNLEKNKELFNFCKSKGYSIVMIGSREDYSLSRGLEGGYNLITTEGSLLDLENFCRVVYSSKLVIGPDTGLIHLADAIGTKVIGLYGPTRDYRFAPYNNKELVVSTNNTSKLMDDITSLEVICKINEILTKNE